MTIAANVFNNFAKARIDHDINGRFDLPLYPSGLDYSENFTTDLKGALIYRSGLKLIDSTDECVFAEFKFSNNQNYLLVLLDSAMRFLSFDANNDIGWVLDGGASTLEITTPWPIADAKEIASRDSYAQNFDAMIFCHEDYEPQKLIRNSANDFTLRPYARKDDPFPLTWQATKTITAVTNGTTAQITTSAAHGYSVGDRVKIASIVGMTELNSWTAAILTVPTSTTFTIDVDTTNFTGYSSGGTTAKVLTGSYPKTCKFNDGRLVYARDTTLFFSEDGQYFIHTLPASVTDASAIQVTIAEIAQDIEWLQPNDNSLVVGSADSIGTINGGSNSAAITSSTIKYSTTSAKPAAPANPVRKDGLVFYSGLEKRNLHYFSYDVLSESFRSSDANIFSYSSTKGLIKRVRIKEGKTDLIYVLMADGTFCSLTFNLNEKILGWHPHSTYGEVQDISVISDNNGKAYMFASVLRNGVYYIEQEVPLVEWCERDEFFTGDKNADDYAFQIEIGEQLRTTVYLDNAEVVSDLRTASLTYDSGAGTITAGSASFTSGDVGKEIVFKTSTGYEYGRFSIDAYTSTTVVSVSVVQTPHANTYSSWYLTFSTVSGLSRFNSNTVGVVADGAYFNDFTVSGGSIDFGKQVAHAVIGYKYSGVAKTFPLGAGTAAGVNTQVKPKSLSAINLRAIASAGGKFGSSRYSLEPIQNISRHAINYLPAPLINGTVRVVFSDFPDVDKALYIVQDVPGPLHVTAALPEVNYV